MVHRSRLLGIGMSVPSRVVSNHELATLMETSNEWIIERTGIEERRWVSPGETGTTMATAASKEALERSGLATRFFFSSRRRHTRLSCDWSSDVCSSDLGGRRII